MEWSAQLGQLMATCKVSYNELSSLIGQLNHVALVIPEARNFINNLCKAEKKANR